MDSKDKYRQVSILPNVSKIFEQCVFHQFYSFMPELLSKYQFGPVQVMQMIICHK